MIKAKDQLDYEESEYELDTGKPVHAAVRGTNQPPAAAKATLRPLLDSYCPHDNRYSHDATSTAPKTTQSAAHKTTLPPSSTTTSTYFLKT